MRLFLNKHCNDILVNFFSAVKQYTIINLDMFCEFEE